MTLRWFRASLNMGHIGAGKSTDETVYIQAPDAVAAMDVAAKFPGAKKSRRGFYGNSLLHVESVPPGARRWYWRRRRRRGIIAARRET